MFVFFMQFEFQKTDAAINKLNDQLNDLLKYKIFIDNLTPNDFLQSQKLKTQKAVEVEEPPSEQDLLKLRYTHDDDDNESFANVEV